MRRLSFMMGSGSCREVYYEMAQSDKKNEAQELLQQPGPARLKRILFEACAERRLVAR